MLGRLRGAAAVLLIWVAVCASVNAQENRGQLAIGASFSQTHPSATEDRGNVHLGLLWRFGQGHDGWGWAYGLSWYSTRLDTNLSDQRVELGEVHVRPLLAGYGYSRRFGSARVTAQLLAGYTFSSFQINEENVPTFRPENARRRSPRTCRTRSS